MGSINLTLSLNHLKLIIYRSSKPDFSLAKLYARNSRTTKFHWQICLNPTPRSTNTPGLLCLGTDHLTYRPSFPGSKCCKCSSDAVQLALEMAYGRAGMWLLIGLFWVTVHRVYLCSCSFPIACPSSSCPWRSRR